MVELNLRRLHNRPEQPRATIRRRLFQIHVAFFYLFTALHALHVMGGLGGLLRVIRKLGLSTLRRSTLNATAYYWHFMGVLWLYVFALLAFAR